MQDWAQADLTQSIHLGIIIDGALSSLNSYVKGWQADENQRATLEAVRDVFISALEFVRGQVKPGPRRDGIRPSQAYLLMLRGLPNAKSRGDVQAAIGRMLGFVDKSLDGSLNSPELLELRRFLEAVRSASMDESSEIVAAYESMSHHRL